MDINYDSLSDFHATLDASFQNALKAPRTLEYPQISTEIRSGSERNVYKFLKSFPKMREWIGQRLMDETESAGYTLANRLFELSFKIKVTEMQDDSGGLIPMYGSIAGLYADSVARFPDELMMGEVLPGGTTNLCYDGQNYFDTDHPVGASTMSNMMGGAGTAWYLLDTSKPIRPLIFQPRIDPTFAAMTDFANPHVFANHEFVWGAHRRCEGGYGMWQTAVHSAQTLDATNLQAALTRMGSFTDDRGRKLNCRGNLLVVPQSLEFTAKSLLDVQRLASGADNLMYKYLPVLVSAHL
jgi:phage major head subunit gpT-like protein